MRLPKEKILDRKEQHFSLFGGLGFVCFFLSFFFFASLTKFSGLEMVREERMASVLSISVPPVVPSLLLQ